MKSIWGTSVLMALLVGVSVVGCGGRADGSALDARTAPGATAPGATPRAPEVNTAPAPSSRAPNWLRIARTEQVNAVVEALGTQYFATSTGVVEVAPSGAIRWYTPESHGIPSLSVTAAAVGLRGEVWFGTERGIFSIRDGKVSVPPGESHFVSPRGLAVDYLGRIWVTTMQGVRRVDGGVVTDFTLADLGLSDGIVRGVVAGGEAVWLEVAPQMRYTEPSFVGGGLVGFLPDRTVVLDATRGLPSPEVRDIGIDKEGTLFGTIYRDTEDGAGAHLIVSVRDGIPSFEHRPGVAYDFAVSRDGTWAVRVDDTVVIRDPLGRERSLHLAAAHNNLRLAFAGASGWPTLIGEGVFEYDGTAFRPRDVSPTDLPTNRLRAAARGADGAMWIATEDKGLLRFDGDSFQVWDETSPFGSRSALAIDVDARGVVWAVTSEYRLVRFDGLSWRSWASPLPVTLFNRFEIVMTAACADQVWIGAIGGGEGGLLGFDGQSWKRYDHRSMPHHSVTSVDCHPDTGVWFGTYKTAARFQGGVFSESPLGEHESFDFVRNVRVDRQKLGRVWVSSQAGGLGYWEGGTYQSVAGLNGPTGPGASPILGSAGEGALFVLSAGRLATLDTSTLLSTAADPPAHQSSVEAMIRDARGNAMLVSSKGIALYNPSGVQGSSRYLPR